MKNKKNENVENVEAKDISPVALKLEKKPESTPVETKKSSGKGPAFWIISGLVIILILASGFGVIAYRSYKMAKDAPLIVSEISKTQEEGSGTGTASGIDRDDIFRILENQANSQGDETSEGETKDIADTAQDDPSEIPALDDDESGENQSAEDAASDNNSEEENEDATQEEYDFDEDILYIRAKLNSLEPEDYDSVNLSDQEMGV